MASATVGVAITGIAIGGLSLVLEFSVPHPESLVTGLVLAAFGFSALGVLMAAIPTDQTSDVMMLATLVKFPVIFVSGIFIPVENLPEWGRLVAYGSPLTYLVKATKYGLGTGESALIWLVGLLLFFVAAFGLAVGLHRRTLPRRL